MSEQYIAPDTTTSDWISYPFEVDGIQFVSKVNKLSKLGKRIFAVPAPIFIQMNQGAIRDCIGSVATMTRSEIISELERINEGGSEAILELA